MRFLKMNFKYAIVLMASVAVFSCSKGDTGDTGPIGPAGVDGINGVDGVDGADGLDGQNGADGQDGNANVLASSWIDSDFSTASTNSTFFNVEDSSFDGTIINSGVVMVYGKQVIVPSGDEQVHPLPHTIFNESYSFNITPNELNGLILTPGRIQFTARSIDNTAEVFDRFNQFRYVIVPSTSSSGKSSMNYENMTYEEVMDQFGLDY